MGRAAGRVGIGALLVALIGAPGAPAQDLLRPRMSDNVDHVANVPLEHRANGGRLVGRYFYVTTGADLSIFDVSNPEAPALTGQMNFGTGSAWEQDAYYLTGYEEDVDTNGRLLLRADSPLQVIDVSDPRAPKTIGTLDGASQHTISCVLDCTWAYGSEGAIVDLRDPTRPVEAGNWMDADPAGDATFGHDVTEVAPGIVLTATDPMLLLDARTDPSQPTVLARSDAPGFLHGTHWPNDMADRFALAGGEVTGPGCANSDGATLQSWDTTGWQENRTFTLVDEYRVTPGTIDDGRHVDSRYCAHWFDPHPGFRDGGLVSMAWYEHGTRFVRVRADGKLEEAGWFLPPDGWAWAAYWITDRIVYVTDHHRGIDILRWKGEVPIGPPISAAPTAAAPPAPTPVSQKRPRFADLVAVPRTGTCLRRRRLRIAAREPQALRSIEVRMRGRRPLVARGRRLSAPLRLKRLPRRRFGVQITATTAAGERLTVRRTYRGCR